ncbi:hypothetical protein [Microvirga zambiensis]|uniref:hypothetical protein n=1 Tax=Microvirga zambiensis TaxID=1402137 RepID=UPI00191F39E4|nr:hypothetical protein [Microvirga zambiensis]
MIIALLALAVAMILGGLLTTFFGWDIVLVERGWTMVIAGSVIAASGAILLGIAAAVSKLSRIQTLLSQIQEESAREAVVGVSPSLAGLSLAAASGGVIAAASVADADEAEAKDEAHQPVLPLFAEEDRSEGDEGKVQAAEWPEAPRADEPALPFPPRTTPPPATPRDEEDETDMKVPDFLLAGRDREADEEPRVADGADIYNRDVEEEREPEVREFDDRDDRGESVAESEPEPDKVSEIEPVPVQPDLEEEPEEEIARDEGETATVVGTYNSGDNKYVMFSDGSIEAQTPSGVFRFKSLEELKEFIAAGGEGNSSSAI